jgi:hypothetical protein
MTLGLVTALGFAPHSAWAFNSMTHAQMVKTATRWIADHPEAFPYSARWLKNPELRSILIRANVDADYLPNVWIGSPIFDRSFAASTFGILNPFSTLLHHVNASAPGRYWEYDGYSFQGSSRRGRDLFSSLVAVKLDSDLSSPFGGRSPLGGMYATELGPYRTGFRGDDADWKALYGEGPSLRATVFPPAYVPAGLAWEKLLASPRAETAKFEISEAAIPAIGLDGTSEPARKYWRREIPGLPRDIELLGFAIHLAEDMAVPQHARATADLCHVEFEALVDRLACTGSDVSTEELEAQKEFVDGTYDWEKPLPECQALADPNRIRTHLETLPFLAAQPGLDAATATLAMAKESVKWRFGKRWLGLFYTRLPSGKVVEGKSCEAILAHAEVAAELKSRYTLGVAVTVRLLETAAREYELAHSL